MRVRRYVTNPGFFVVVQGERLDVYRPDAWPPLTCSRCVDLFGWRIEWSRW